MSKILLAVDIDNTLLPFLEYMRRVGKLVGASVNVYTPVYEIPWHGCAGQLKEDIHDVARINDDKSAWWYVAQLTKLHIYMFPEMFKPYEDAREALFKVLEGYSADILYHSLVLPPLSGVVERWLKTWDFPRGKVLELNSDGKLLAVSRYADDYSLTIVVDDSPSVQREALQHGYMPMSLATPWFKEFHKIVKVFNSWKQFYRLFAKTVRELSTEEIT